MDGVESMTRGWWRPTPGSIYPLLKELTDQGILRRLEDGRYDLTARGRRQAEEFIGPRARRPRTAADAIGQIQSYVDYLEDLKNSSKDDLKSIERELEELEKRISSLRAGDKRGEA